MKAKYSPNFWTNLEPKDINQRILKNMDKVVASAGANSNRFVPVDSDNLRSSQVIRGYTIVWSTDYANKAFEKNRQKNGAKERWTEYDYKLNGAKYKKYLMDGVIK